MKNLVFPVGRLILDLQKKTVSQHFFFFFWKPQLVSLVGSIEKECWGDGKRESTEWFSRSYAKSPSWTGSGSSGIKDPPLTLLPFPE